MTLRQAQIEAEILRIAARIRRKEARGECTAGDLLTVRELNVQLAEARREVGQ